MIHMDPEKKIADYNQWIYINLKELCTICVKMVNLISTYYIVQESMTQIS